MVCIQSRHFLSDKCFSIFEFDILQCWISSQLRLNCSKGFCANLIYQPQIQLMHKDLNILVNPWSSSSANCILSALQRHIRTSNCEWQPHQKNPESGVTQQTQSQCKTTMLLIAHFLFSVQPQAALASYEIRLFTPNTPPDKFHTTWSHSSAHPMT